jgi:hypothetical protein
MNLLEPLDWVSCSSSILRGSRTLIGGLHEPGEIIDSSQHGCLAGLLRGSHSTLLVGISKANLKDLTFIILVIDPRRFG